MASVIMSLQFQSYADVEALPPLAMFGGRVALAEVTLLVAEAKTGKSICCASVASIISAGLPFPGETDSREPRSVVLVSHEDNPNTSTVWRLRAHGADLGNVFDVSLDVNGNEFHLPEHIGLLRSAVDQTQAQLVVLDNYSAISTAPMTVKGCRSVIGPLQRMARETGCAVVVISHTRKDGQMAGSQGLIDAVRCELRLTRDSQSSDRILSVARTNLSGTIPDVRFTFEGEGTDTVIRWLDREAIQERSTAWRRQATPASSRMPHTYGAYGAPKLVKG
jgi:predicted ATP-dependent serine protease